ncbi:MAG: hypothetical protein B6U89_01390 [Desulfurococcales archaeon ex4484_58]|nr:MAG: hypothetical protein B6U89_01390 [Desulfurococcales archaeon ex4484_58]
MSRKIDPIKKMAELLKSGATMLAETCPVENCNLPLFKLKSGEIICPVHGKVYMVKTEEEVKEIEEEITIRNILDKLEHRVLEIINSYTEETLSSPDELIGWLEVLERLMKIKSYIREKQS